MRQLKYDVIFGNGPRHTDVTMEETVRVISERLQRGEKFDVDVLPKEIPKMKLSDFQATRRWCQDLGKHFQDDTLEGESGFTYGDVGSWWIALEEGSGKFWTIIGNFDTCDLDLLVIERELYHFTRGEL